MSPKLWKSSKTPKFELVFLDGMFYFARYERIGTLFKGTQAGAGAEIDPFAMKACAGIFGWVFDVSTAGCFVFGHCGVFGFGQSSISLVMRIVIDIPRTKCEHSQRNTDQSREKDRRRFESEPVLSKRPEQNDPDQKCGDIGKGGPIMIFIFHVLAFLYTCPSNVAAPPQPTINTRKNQPQTKAHAEYFQTGAFIYSRLKDRTGCRFPQFQTADDGSPIIRRLNNYILMAIGSVKRMTFMMVRMTIKTA